MSRIRVTAFSISVEGYGAAVNQDMKNPFGTGGMVLTQWVFPTQSFQQKLFGNEGGTTGIDMLELGYQCAEHVATTHATPVVLEKR